MTTIIVTGTPGTGKTTLAKALAKEMTYKYVDVNNVIAKEKLVEEYDSEKKCDVVDEQKLADALVQVIGNEGIIIDSHMSQNVPAEKVDLCIVTKCELSVLKKRLEDKGYDEKKVKENMDAEIFDTSFEDSKAKGHKILIVDTTKELDIKDVTKKVKEALK